MFTTKFSAEAPPNSKALQLLQEGLSPRVGNSTQTAAFTRFLESQKINCFNSCTRDQQRKP